MKGLWKRVVALLTVCLLMIPFVGTGSAVSGPDLDSPCSLTVTTANELVEEQAENFLVDLYYVAALREGLTFVVNDAFGALKEDLKPDEDGLRDSQALSQKALLIATNGNEPVTPSRTCSLNNMPIDGLDAGLYLIVVRKDGQDIRIEERIDESTGESFYASVMTDPNNEYVFAPVLVTLPTNMESADIETGNGGEWLYDVAVYLKVETNELAEKKIILHKTSETGEKLPDAKFKLYATRLAGDSLSDDTITTYVEGEGYVTLYCVGTYTTNKNGDIMLDTPLLDDNTLYAWVETKAPDGYTLDPEPHFFYAYGREVPYDYAENWMNQPGEVLETHLRYDNEHPNATGSVTFERRASEDKNRVVLYNAEDGQPVYVRVKAYDSHEGNTVDGKSLGDFFPSYSGDWRDGNDGYYYYDDPLKPGDATEPLLVMVEGTELTDNNGKSLPRAGRVAIVYDFVLAMNDEENGGFYPADWDQQYNEAGEMSLRSGEAMIQPMAQAQGGYVIEFYSDLRITGTARYVERCYYDLDSDEYKGVTVKNTRDETSPPDDSGAELPETGGIGTTLFTITGGGLIAIALLLLAIQKRRRA